MTFQVEITPIAETQIEQAYRWYRERNPEFADRWFRGLMNTIATLQEKPQRCALAVEHTIFPEEVHQHLNKFLIGLHTDAHSAFMGSKLNPMICVPLEYVAPTEKQLL
jgi:plasmid stabilization system protein ParE